MPLWFLSRALPETQLFLSHSPDNHIYTYLLLKERVPVLCALHPIFNFNWYSNFIVLFVIYVHWLINLYSKDIDTGPFWLLAHYGWRKATEENWLHWIQHWHKILSTSLENLSLDISGYILLNFVQLVQQLNWEWDLFLKIYSKLQHG